MDEGGPSFRRTTPCPSESLSEIHGHCSDVPTAWRFNDDSNTRNDSSPSLFLSKTLMHDESLVKAGAGNDVGGGKDTEKMKIRRTVYNEEYFGF